MKMRYVGYKTVDAIMAEITERIYQAVMDDFDTQLSEEEYEYLVEEAPDNEYFDRAREQKLWVEGYEDVTFEELERRSYEDILKVHNLIYGESLTLDDIKEMVC